MARSGRSWRFLPKKAFPPNGIYPKTSNGKWQCRAWAILLQSSGVTGYSSQPPSTAIPWKRTGKKAFHKAIGSPILLIFHGKSCALARSRENSFGGKKAITRKPVNARHLKNSYASQSPVTDGKYVFAFFGDQGMYCYDFQGNLIWSRDLGNFTMRNNWGMGSSPVLYKNFVIQTCDQEKGGSFIVALDKNTGKPAWKMERDELSSWSTPYVYDKGARPELIVNATNAVRSYDPENGKLLWECRGPATSITTPTPTFMNGLIIVSSGFLMEPVRPITAFRPGASGDITLKEGETSSAAIAWRQKVGAPYIPSPVAYDGRIYVVLDQGFIACYDANTGKEIYGRTRIEPGAVAGFSASPVAMNGMLFCSSEDGDVYVVKAGDQYELLAKNSLGESIMASPAVSGGNMFIRTIGHLFCIQ